MNSIAIKVKAMINVHPIERIAKDAIELVNKLKIPVYLTFWNDYTIYVFESSSEREIIDEFNSKCK